MADKLPLLNPNPSLGTPEQQATAQALARAMTAGSPGAALSRGMVPVNAPASVPVGPQSLIPAVPPQSVSNFNQAVQQLGLTPQEQFLYQHHLNNLWGGGRVVQPSGDVSTVLQAVVPGPDGQFYNIPTVWNGQALPVDAATRQARLAGLGNFPSYATPEAADARYLNDMHPLMERETAAWLAQHPVADPMMSLIMRGADAQHPLLQRLEQLRQQQAEPGAEAISTSAPPSQSLNQSSVPGTADNPLIQPGPGGAPVGARDVPGSADRNRFWNPSNIAPYSPPGVPDDRINDAGLLRLLLQGSA